MGSWGPAHNRGAISCLPARAVLPDACAGFKTKLDSADRFPIREADYIGSKAFSFFKRAEPPGSVRFVFLREADSDCGGFRRIARGICLRAAISFDGGGGRPLFSRAFPIHLRRIF